MALRLEDVLLDGKDLRNPVPHGSGYLSESGSRCLCFPAELLPLVNDVSIALMLAIHARHVSTLTKQLQMRHLPSSLCTYAGILS